MTVEIIDVEQGSEAWFMARLGVPSASRFADVLAKGEGKTRGKYLNELAAEIVRGTPESETFTNFHMERGKLLEDEARQTYALIHDQEPVRVGFIKNGRAGCSPDSLIGDNGGLEIKTALGHIQIDRLRRGTLPSEHVAQVQGSLWISEREWWDFCSYSPGLPLFVFRVHRDEATIKTIANAVLAFTEEMDALVNSIRSYTSFKTQAAA